MTQLKGKVMLSLVALGLLASPAQALAEVTNESHQPVVERQQSVEARVNIGIHLGPPRVYHPYPIVVYPRPYRAPGYDRFGPGWVNICGYPTGYAGCYRPARPHHWHKVTPQDLQEVQEEVNASIPTRSPILGSPTLQTIVDSLSVTNGDLGPAYGGRVRW